MAHAKQKLIYHTFISADLIGEADAFSEPHCLISGFHALHADNRRHDESRLRSLSRIYPSLRAISCHPLRWHWSVSAKAP